jgi:hypothetical protein
MSRSKALLWTLAVTSLAWASEPFPSGLYRVTTETGMPNLEENLRYSTDTVERCLTGQDELPPLFRVLEHPSLKGCHLDRETREGERITSALICEGGKGTTGEAVWELGNRQVTGTLRVKLGGKNMTFYQRVTARLLRPC